MANPISENVISLFKDTDFLDRGFPNKRVVAFCSATLRRVVGEFGGPSDLLLYAAVMYSNFGKI